MKNYLTTLLILLSIALNGQTTPFQDWQTLQNIDHRLMPKFGNITKSKAQIIEDKKFIKSTLEKFKNAKTASDYYVKQGFKYIKKGNFKSAMYRFNQAYLLYPKNSDIYWGYGEVLEFFNEYTRAKLQYKEGLALNPKNENILMKYGSVNILDFEDLTRYDDRKAKRSLNIALSNLHKAHSIQPNNLSVNYQLAQCYLYNNDCNNSTKHYKIAEKINQNGIPKNIVLSFKNKCVVTNQCDEVKTGVFKVTNSKVGDIIIKRDNQYQTEEYLQHGITTKMKLVWLDDCTYTLELVKVLKNTNNINLPREVTVNKIFEVSNEGYSQITTNKRSNTQTELHLKEL